MYFIKHLEDFHSIPAIFKDEVVFLKAFEKAEVANLNPSEQEGYEYSKKVYRDMKGVIDSAFVNGKAEGIAEEQERSNKKIHEVAKALKNAGQSLEFIASVTGLSMQEIVNL